MTLPLMTHSPLPPIAIAIFPILITSYLLRLADMFRSIVTTREKTIEDLREKLAGELLMTTRHPYSKPSKHIHTHIHTSHR